MHSIYMALVIMAGLLAFDSAVAQSSQYRRPKKNVVTPKEDAKKGDKAQPAKAGEKDDYKVDLTDVEKKYWAPKDTDFSVVQSRTYTKEKRFSLSLQYGPVVNDIYNEGFNLGLTLNYFQSERHGFGAHFISANWQNTKAIDKFRNEVGGGAAGVEPDRGRMTSYYGVSYSWVPIYAKMSLLGQKILYFDMAITPTLGMMNYDQISEVGNKNQSAIAFGVDVTQYFFLNRHWAIRADLKNIWFKEDRVVFKTGAPLAGETNTTTIFLMGITYHY